MLITQLIKALIIIYLFTFFIYLFTFLLSLRTSIIQLPSQTVPPTQCTDTQRNPQKAPYRVIRTDDDSILHLWICSRVVICISRIAHLREFLSKVKTWIQLLINRNTCTFFLYLMLVLGTGGALWYIRQGLPCMKDMLSCPSCVPPTGGHAVLMWFHTVSSFK